MSNKDNITQSKKFSEKIEWIEKKDLVYWLVIIILVWLLSSDYGKNNPIVLDNWNFAGTIVSIILAILAIVYTFAQNSTTLFTSNKLSESAVKIENVTKKIEEISVDDLFLKLESRVNEMVDVIDSSLKEEMDKQNQMIKEFMESTNIVSPFEDSFNIMTEEEWEKYIRNFINTGDVISEILYHVYLKYKKNLKYNFTEYATWVVEQSPSITGEHKMQYHYFTLGMLTGARSVYESINVFKLESSDRDLIVTEISPIFISSIEKYIDESKVEKINRFIEYKYGKI